MAMTCVVVGVGGGVMKICTKNNNTKNNTEFTGSSTTNQSETDKTTGEKKVESV